VAQIKAVIAKLPTYGIGAFTAFSSARAGRGLKAANHKRVDRLMKVRGLLLDRHTNVIGAGVPMASRSAATMLREWWVAFALD
jgi:hypothetical protein